MKPLVKERLSPHVLVHYTPLRYPGGKGKLARYIKELIRKNQLLDGEYVEPYAGGAAIALELLFHEYVSRVHINDLSRPVYAFWQSVLGQTDALCKLVRDTPLTLSAWDKQKRIFAAQEGHDDVALGFATFFLNRTNRSGILNGGVIGGRGQAGPWRIDARFNRGELIRRIEAIAKLKARIMLTRMDALKFLKSVSPSWPAKTLIYLDPPYYLKGRDLYYDFYRHEDHQQVAKFVTSKLVRQRWIVSYDNVATIRELYRGCRRLVYTLGYSAREATKGTEIMFFSDSIRVPPLVGPFKVVRGTRVSNNEVRSSLRREVQSTRSKNVGERGHRRTRLRETRRPTSIIVTSGTPRPSQRRCSR